ncbi:probable G-protein coupled receptor 158 isoform X2 [Anthonomus grandis grandis]|uniref:probable G-protein coupled receptor 158 isoform X2 n=1 Tax=Anthonomus grandis grandis TaxID=2921223 RepID=UPI0021663C26|nr:probable G-protein coupled receptor 158 isoform X2 [Anthonomus grandis grandis]
MKTTFILLFLLFAVADSKNQTRPHDDCKIRILSNNVPATGLNYNVSKLIKEIGDDLLKNPHGMNFSLTSRKLLASRADVFGVILRKTNDASVLALNINSRLRIFPNRTAETDVFWRTFDSTDGWGKPFKDCDYFSYSWFYVYAHRLSDLKIGLFIKLDLDQCDDRLKEIFGGGHKCGESLKCINEYDGKGDERRGRYRCVCQRGFFYPGANLMWMGISGEDLESGKINNTRCEPCPIRCPEGCSITGNCIAQGDAYLRTCIVVVQLVSMGIVLILALVVFKQRKTKAIATGMWTILEIILLGFLILYSTVIIRSLEPSIERCLLEPWIREIGFIICYGAIVLKLYRHLIEFRTRKAHRWVVKDTDLLKYLLIMILSGLAYMAAFTALTLNFVSENYSLLFLGTTFSGEQYEGCKYLWWDYVTEVGEIAILVFGIHLAYASRNARTQFHERNYLCAASSLELALCIIFYSARILIFDKLHPDIVLLIYCIRSQVSQTVSLLLIFLPKFWYQQKQVRTLAQEYSCRYPLDAFKDPPSQRSCASGNNSDVEISEISIADMNPDDIRAELKRLYLQLEMFKSKTICRDNPHISKRRGGRKAQHRKFSLQSLQTKQREKDKKRDMDTEITEAEVSRTPEDSICSIEGPSAVYSELPATNQI